MNINFSHNVNITTIEGKHIMLFDQDQIHISGIQFFIPTELLEKYQDHHHIVNLTNEIIELLKSIDFNFEVDTLINTDSSEHGILGKVVIQECNKISQRDNTIRSLILEQLLQKLQFQFEDVIFEKLM